MASEFVCGLKHPGLQQKHSVATLMLSSVTKILTDVILIVWHQLKALLEDICR